LEEGEMSGGLMVPRNNVSALVGAMNRVFDNVALAQEMGKKARFRVETQFSSHSVGQKLQDFLLPNALAAQNLPNLSEIEALSSIEKVI
jgi:glycosyltransferase involved in cell wall biosynthesis